jgi:cytochrome c oxidase assembly protein subunit 15
MTPAMVGGVFWEHLHRLVAGGLVILFALATWLAWREVPDESRWIVRASAAGVLLLLVQAVFGGLTVLWRLPDAVSTTHLGLALAFLGLAVVLAAATSRRRMDRPPLSGTTRAFLRGAGSGVAVLVFLQCLVGGYVRHSDAGMACGPGILCNGGLIPPVFDHAVGLQYVHRVLGIVTAAAVVWLATGVLRRTGAPFVRRMAWTTLGLVAAQVVLGFIGTWTILAVLPVSLHTLGAAAVLAGVVALATWGWLEPTTKGPATARTAAAQAA